MKKTGCIMEFHHERNAELKQAFIDAWKAASASDPMPSAVTVSAMAAKMPASRFWVSEERAYNVVSRMLRGMPVLDTMRGPKQRMFAEICRRVKEMRAQKPSATLVELIAKVVYQPAPEFYMQPSTLAFLINRAKKQRRRHAQ